MSGHSGASREFFEKGHFRIKKTDEKLESRGILASKTKGHDPSLASSDPSDVGQKGHLFRSAQ